MKTLSVKQPWASLICSGIKDIENRSWSPKTVPGRILIHASGTKVPKNFEFYQPETMVSSLRNHMLFGNLADYQDMPTSAIIGYVTVKGFTEASDSLWADPESVHWELEDAWLFDEPILNVNGKLNLWDYPLDEENLPPAHQVEIRLPYYDGKTLVVPANEEVWDTASTNGFDKECLCLDMNDPFTVDVLCKENSWDLRETEKLRFERGGKYVDYYVENCGSDIFKNEKDEDYYYKNGKGEDVPWLFAIYLLRKGKAS